MVERKEKLKKKRVHGKILNDIEEVGIKETCTGCKVDTSQRAWRS